MLRLVSCVFVLLLFAASCSHTQTVGESGEKGRLITENYSADVFLLMQVVKKLPRSEEIDRVIHSRRELLGEEKQVYEADYFRVIPERYYIPSRSSHSTSQYQMGEFRFDPRKLQAAELNFRELLGQPVEFIIDYKRGASPVVGTKAIIGISTVPGFAYYGIPSQTSVFFVPPESYPQFRSLKMDAVYPEELVDNSDDTASFGGSR